MDKHDSRAIARAIQEELAETYDRLHPSERPVVRPPSWIEVADLLERIAARIAAVGT